MEILFNIGEKYGLWGICGLVVCMGLFILFKWLGSKLSADMESGLEKVGTKLTEQMSKQNDTLTKVIVEQQERLLDHLLTEKKANQSRHNDMINDKEDLAVDINNYLKDIMNIHNSQRAYILEFHNHNENLSGTPFVKFTCKYEWFELKDGYEPLIGNCKDMAFAAIAQVFKDVRTSKNQCVIYNDLEKFGEQNPSLAYYLVKQNTKTLIFKGLYDKNNVFIAVIVLEYNHIINAKDINLNKLHVQASEITQLINLRYKYDE